MGKPILCVDFDGVLHSYVSGWQGADTVSDPPVRGAILWLWRCIDQFQVVIYSARSANAGAVMAMRSWLEHWGQEYGLPRTWTDNLEFACEKPKAFLTIDDRAIRFNGDFWSISPEALLEFRPWNRLGHDEPHAFDPTPYRENVCLRCGFGREHSVHQGDGSGTDRNDRLSDERKAALRQGECPSEEEVDALLDEIAALRERAEAAEQRNKDLRRIAGLDPVDALADSGERAEQDYTDATLLALADWYDARRRQGDLPITAMRYAVQRVLRGIGLPGQPETREGLAPNEAPCEVCRQPVNLLHTVGYHMGFVHDDCTRHSPPPQGNAMEELVSLVEELCERIDHDAEDIGSRARPVGELVPLLGPAVNKARRALAAHAEPSPDMEEALAALDEMWGMPADDDERRIYYETLHRFIHPPQGSAEALVDDLNRITDSEGQETPEYRRICHALAAHAEPRADMEEALAALERIYTRPCDYDGSVRDVMIVQRSIRASRGVPEWRRIESAPAGERVLLKSGLNNPPVVGMAHHHDDGTLCTVLHYNGDVLVGAFRATHWRRIAEADGEVKR